MTNKELVTKKQLMLLNDILSVDIAKISERSWAQTVPFVIGVDARPIAVLLQSAARANRVYELMSINRPGDLLNYFWVSWIDLGPEVIRQIKGYQRKPDQRTYMKPETPLEELPFRDVDRCFSWQGDDTTIEADHWCAVRDKGFWRDRMNLFFPMVQEAQQALRSSTDLLVQRELAMIDYGSHPLLYLSTVERKAWLDGVPPDKSKFPASLLAFILDKIQSGAVRSVSCGENDFPLWKMLIEEQVKRADQLGVAPKEALKLSCTDEGLSYIYSPYWGADIHIPYEGACLADLFIKPDWRYTFPESDTAGGKLSDILFKPGQGYAKEQCYYLLTKKDLGTLQCARRAEFGKKWILYESNSLYEPKQ